MELGYLKEWQKEIRLRSGLINEIKQSDISMWGERWFLSSNAKDIGTLYFIFALFSGLIGTAFSVLIRLELLGSNAQYIADNQLYNSIITTHAIVMLFFMVIPAVIGGFGNFLLSSLMIGQNIAFSRSNNISFWLLFFSSSLFIFASIIESRAGTGWTLYPLLGIHSHNSCSVIFITFAIYFYGLSSLLGAMNLITTILSMKSIGIRLHKLTLLGWAIIVTAVLLLLFLPVLAGEITTVLTDGHFGIHFSQLSGKLHDRILWLFGHPQIFFTVYILISCTYLLRLLHPKLSDYIFWGIMFILGLFIYYYFTQCPLEMGIGPLNDNQVSNFFMQFRYAIKQTIDEIPHGSVTYHEIMERYNRYYMGGDYTLRVIISNKCNQPVFGLGSTAFVKEANGQVIYSSILTQVLN